MRHAQLLSHITGLYLVTAVCGFVDAACFLSFGHVFAEIMTGNLLFLCFQIGVGATFFLHSKYLMAIGLFVIGAACGGQVLRRGRSRSRIGFVIEWLLLLAALTLTLVLRPGPVGTARDIVVGVLAFAMGLQNALIRTHGVPDLATNVMTLTMTGLIADTVVARGRHERWDRRAASIALFMVSAGLGAFLTSRWGPSAPLAAAAAIFAVGLMGLAVPPQEEQE